MGGFKRGCVEALPGNPIHQRVGGVNSQAATTPGVNTKYSVRIILGGVHSNVLLQVGWGICILKRNGLTQNRSIRTCQIYT